MIRDLLNEPSGMQAHSQVCIVGAGAAGISLAVLLQRAGRQVTLLEGGGLIREDGNDALHAKTTGLGYRGIREGRADGLGGTTTLWGGQILELNTLDFERRPWVPGSGWPLRKADLAPYYRKALMLEGLSEAITSDDAVWAGAGERRPTFPRLQTYLSRWCPEPNFATLYNAELRSAGISVWLHARAVRLQISDGRVSSVVARTPAGTEHEFTADQIVFCLGAIESCRFFLQPRDGGLPWNESGLLGRYFQDHIDCDAATIMPHDPGELSRSFDALYVRRLKYLPKLRLAEEEQRKRSLLHVGATLYAPHASTSLRTLRESAQSLTRGRRPDHSPAQLARSLGAVPALMRQASRYAFRGRGSLPTREVLALRVHCEQEPCGASTINLSKERDSFGMYQAEVCWKISDVECETIYRFTQIVAEALAPIAAVRPHPGLLHRSAGFREACQDSFHHMGGMRMDASARSGLVDTDLRLHGVKNCFVCSTAVFPTSGFSNPTHTLLALTVRLAEQLARRA